MNWYAIRSVYLFESRPDGTNVFEERIVSFHAENADAAHEKAIEERRQYAEMNGFTAHPHQVGYEQDGDALLDGCELWSQLFESRDSLEAFYEKRYLAFAYHPEL